MFQWVEQSTHHLSLSFLSIILAVLLFKLTRYRATKLNLPPSPSRLPIIGNLHQLGSLPHHSLRTLAQKHGPLMMLHFGQKQVLVVSSADAARETIKTQDLIFSNRPSVSSVEGQLYNNRDIAFSPYGEYWRQVKKVCVLQLLTAARVESYRSVREEESYLMINTIRKSCSSASSVVNLSEMLMSFTNDVICRVTLGRKIYGELGGGKFFKMMTEYGYLAGAFNVGDFIPWLAWVNRFNGINARVKKNMKDLDSFFESAIEEHIKRGKRGSEAVEDFVDVLLGIEKDCSLGVPFGKDNIKAIILDVFIAGTDTSSATSTWVMTELIRHPEIMKEVQKEIREIGRGKLHIGEDDLREMHYLKMVIKETLRLHPPAPLLLPRESIQDTKLQGYDIPAKTRVLVNAWAIARDPLSWEEPEEFNPKRFMKTSVDYKGQDFEFIPFGAGRRGCPAILLGIHNIELPLANLLYHFDWTLPDGASAEDVDVDEDFGLSVNKKSPLLLVASLHTF